MSAHILPPGGGRSFGPGIRTKIEYGQSDDFAAFESELPPRWVGPPRMYTAYTTRRSMCSTDLSPSSATERFVTAR